MLGAFPSIDKLGRRVIVVLQGFPCSWGKCRFCPFYLEQSTNLRELLEKDRAIIEEAMRVADRIAADRVTVFNGGSFFELPLAIIEMLKPLTRGRVVDIESRPEFLTLDSILTVVKILSPSKLVIRVGFECVDEFVRNEVLNKGIPQSEILRISKLREQIKELGLNVDFVAYVLFGIEGISEELVVKSVKEFSRLFDGVIAIRYRKYLPNHPNEVAVSKYLRKFLEANCLYVDWSEGSEWSISESS